MGEENSRLLEAGNIDPPVPAPDTDTPKWYQDVSLEDAEIYIEANLKSAVRSVIAVGYYLKCVRDGELYRDAGYENIWDYARERFGFSKSTASRYMARNDRFSKDGNSPVLDERYSAFNKSQLQEMLGLGEEQLEQVSPDMTVQEIRAMKKPREIPYVEIPGQGSLKEYPGFYPEDMLGEEGPEEPAETARPLASTEAHAVTAEDLIGTEAEEEVQFPGVAISQQPANGASGVCLHRSGFSCTLPDQYKSIPGDGEDCTHKCCWDCVKHGDCRVECYASAHRPAEEQDPQTLEPEEKDPVDPIKRGCITGLSPYGNCVCCGSEGVECCAQCAEPCNCRCGWIPEQARCENSSEQPEDAEKMAAEPLSAYGTPKRVYPPDSLITTEGCEGGHDCFTCAMDCQIRREERYCREAPLGNPFPCEIVKGDFTALPEGCQFVDHDLAYHSAGDGEPDPCCKNCPDPCEYICGRAMEALDQETEIPEAGQESAAISRQEEMSDMELLRSMLEKENGDLSEAIKINKIDPHPDWERMIRKKELLVGALAGMLCDLENMAEPEEHEEPEQPDLPALKNNGQRKDWLNTYHDWPVWFEVPEAAEVYYRYDLEDGCSLVICEYHYWAEWQIHYGNDPERTGTREYMLVPGYHYLEDCKTNRTAMIDKLKEIQKR